jgi:hypothetical protein
MFAWIYFLAMTFRHFGIVKERKKHYLCGYIISVAWKMSYNAIWCHYMMLSCTKATLVETSIKWTSSVCFPMSYRHENQWFFLEDIFCCFFTKKFEEIWEIFVFQGVNSTNFLVFLEKKISKFSMLQFNWKKKLMYCEKYVDTKLEVNDTCYKAKFKTSCRLFIWLVILKPSLGTPMSNTHVHLGIQSLFFPIFGDWKISPKKGEPIKFKLEKNSKNFHQNLFLAI